MQPIRRLSQPSYTGFRRIEGVFLCSRSPCSLLNPTLFPVNKPNRAFAMQLLRCELEGARVDLAAKARRAEEKAQQEAKKAREREQGLQARMAARLRAAEAEIAATAKSIAEFKR